LKGTPKEPQKYPHARSDTERKPIIHKQACASCRIKLCRFTSRSGDRTYKNWFCPQQKKRKLLRGLKTLAKRASNHCDAAIGPSNGACFTARHSVCARPPDFHVQPCLLAPRSGIILYLRFRSGARPYASAKTRTPHQPQKNEQIHVTSYKRKKTQGYGEAAPQARCPFPRSPLPQRRLHDVRPTRQLVSKVGANTHCT